MKKIYFLALILMVCACRTETVQIPVENLVLNETALELEVEEQIRLTVKVLPENATNKNVQWSSSDEFIATVSSEGKVTAHRPGSAVVVVSSEDGGKTTTCAVKVKEPEVLVTSVSLSRQRIELVVGDSETLSATVYPSNATNKSVTWSSTNTSVATVSGGTVKALKTGTATVRVTTSDGSKIAECQVTVKAKIINVESVSLNKNSLTLTEGDSETLSATVYPSNATNKSVTWSSTNTSVATVSGGTVKALKAGTATVRVTTSDGSKTAECQVTIKRVDGIGGHEGIGEKDW